MLRHNSPLAILPTAGSYTNAWTYAGAGGGPDVGECEPFLNRSCPVMRRLTHALLSSCRRHRGGCPAAAKTASALTTQTLGRVSTCHPGGPTHMCICVAAFFDNLSRSAGVVPRSGRESAEPALSEVEWAKSCLLRPAVGSRSGSSAASVVGWVLPSGLADC